MSSRVVHIPEILSIIFASPSLADPDHASNARVCKAWLPLALDVLWRDIKDIKYLVAPLTALKQDERAFVRPPLYKEWTRFHQYARRVRHLSLLHSSQSYRAVFADMGKTRITLHMLPFLNTLLWDESVQFSLMFMHPGIQHYSFKVTTQSSIEFAPYISDILYRLPTLTILEISEALVLRTSLKEQIETLVGGFKNLKKVIFPRFFLVESLMEILSKMEGLEEICFSPKVTRPANPSARTVPNPGKDKFPCLKRLEIGISLDNAKLLDWVINSHASQRLVALHLDAYQFRTELFVHETLVILSSHLYVLEELSISGYTNLELEMEEPLDVNEQITFNMLQPLLSFQSLHHFILQHRLPVAITNQDLELLAKGWPRLRHLVLNAHVSPPYTDYYSLPTLAALVPFAQHCTELTTLGLFLDATVIPLEIAQFKQKVTLEMGFSPITDPTMVALYLSRSISMNARLKGASIMVGDGGCERWFYVEESKVYPSLQKRVDHWGKVRTILPLLFKARWEQLIEDRETRF